MRSPAYMLGALDALVKAGAVSPAYAAGAASVLTKRAGLFWDSAAQNMADNYADWRALNTWTPMTQDKARDLALQSRNWYSRAFQPNAGWGNWFSNRIGKWTSGIRRFFGGSNVPSYEAYDRELRDMENQKLDNYLSEHHVQMPAEVAGALQDGFVRDANRRVADAKATMSDLDRVSAGYTDDYADQYRSTQGTDAIRAGRFKAEHDKESMKQPTATPYDSKMPKSYGTNRKMFYNVGYTNPLSQ